MSLPSLGTVRTQGPAELGGALRCHRPLVVLSESPEFDQPSIPMQGQLLRNLPAPIVSTHQIKSLYNCKLSIGLRLQTPGAHIFLGRGGKVKDICALHGFKVY